MTMSGSFPQQENGPAEKNWSGVAIGGSWGGKKRYEFQQSLH